MMFKSVINFLISILKLIVSYLDFGNPNNMDVEIVFKSDNYLIVNKPEDVFINNHNKEVSNYSITGLTIVK